MALTKTQINYLLEKLNRVVDEKVQQFKNELGGDKNIYEIIIEKLTSGEIPLLSREKLIETITSKIESNNNYYRCNPYLYLPELIRKNDYEDIKKEVQERDDTVSNYKDKLNKAKQDALDKIVLEGVDVESAIAELNKIEV